MTHPQLRNNERQIGLSESRFKNCVRVCFILPQEGNTTEYMAIDKGQPGFDPIVDVGMLAARRIAAEEHDRKNKSERDKRYQEYLRLKEEFGNDS